MSNDTRIAVDVAKAVFEVAISDRPGHVTRRERLPRGQFLAFIAQQPQATVVMEACGSAHYWGRQIRGPRPSSRPSASASRPTLPPQQDRPHRRQGHSEEPAATKTSVRCRSRRWTSEVLTSLHRLRSGWMRERTARLNALRGLLRELGVFIPMGAREGRAPSCGPSSRMPIRNCPRLCGRSSPRPAWRSVRSRRGSSRWNVSWKPLPSSSCRRIPAYHPGNRVADRHRPGGLHWRHSTLPVGKAFRQLPRPHSPGVLERAQAQSGSHLQAGRRLLAHAPHPRGALGACPRAEAAAGPATRVGEQPRQDSRAAKAAGGCRQQAACIAWAVWHHQRPFALIPKPP